MTIGPPRARTLAEVADADGSAKAFALRSRDNGCMVHQSSESAETTDPANVIATLAIDMLDELAEEAKSCGL